MLRSLTRATMLSTMVVAAAAAMPRAEAADAAGSRVVVRAESQRAVSSLLVASEGKLVVKASIAGLKVTIFSGKGEWAALDAADLASAVRRLARDAKVELSYVEANEVS